MPVKPRPVPRRTKQIKLVVSEQEASEIKRRAALAKRSTSDYARLVLLDELPADEGRGVAA